MKRQNLLLLVLSALLFCSCGKSTDTNTAVHFQYDLRNVQDYYVNRGVATDFAVKLVINDSQSTNRTITVTPAGVPQGITFYPASIDVRNSDTFTFYFSANAPIPGSFPIALNCTSPGTTPKSSSFHIIVQANCDSQILLCSLPTILPL